MKHLFIILIILVQWMMGCQTTPPKEASSAFTSQITAGQWDAKVMIKSLETGEANIVGLDVLAQKPEPLRLEVSTSLGISLASILIKGGQIEYILPKQKKYYSGPASSEALAPILKIKVDPRILAAVFFEESYDNWSCQADHGLIVSCQTPEGVLIKWDRQDPESKRISLTSSAFDVQVQIKKFTPKSELPAAAQSLKVPESFKRYKLK